LKIAAAVVEAKPHIEFLETEIFEKDSSNIKVLSDFDGILVPGGFGSRGTEGMISAIQYARERTNHSSDWCFGFQLAVVEFARHVCA